MALTAIDYDIGLQYQGVVDNLSSKTNGWFTRTFFPGVVVSTAQQITFDVRTGARRALQFVEQCVEAPVSMRDGYASYVFKPAYIKDKRAICCDAGSVRLAGETPGMPKTMSERRAAIMQQDAVDQVERLDMRIELMAAETVRTGKVVISGPKYPSRTVDFFRHAGNTVTLAGASRWNQVGVDPLANLRAWADTVKARGGGYPRHVTMTPSAYNVFFSNDFVQAEYKLVNLNSSLGRVNNENDTDAATFKGTIAGFDIWVFQESYVDDSGAAQEVLPGNTVILSNPRATEGNRHFGVIYDEEVNYLPRPYAVKSWVEKDPSCRVGLIQSAPLTVLARANATYAVTVF